MSINLLHDVQAKSKRGYCCQCFIVFIVSFLWVHISIFVAYLVALYMQFVAHLDWYLASSVVFIGLLFLLIRWVDVFFKGNKWVAAIFATMGFIFCCIVMVLVNFFTS